MRTSRRFATPVMVLLCVVLTWILSDYQLYNLTQVGALAIVVLGLNLLMGHLGSISAGHSALMGVGGYGTVLLTTRADVPGPFAIVLATLATCVAGLIVGLPALRIRGLSFALVTLGLAIVFPELVIHFSGLTGGANGLASAPVAVPFGLALTQVQWMYLVVAVSLAVVVFGFLLVASSAYGRGLDAVRVSEDLANSCGVSPGRAGVLTFGVSAALAGFGGGLYQLSLGTATPDTYSFSLSLSLVFASVIGGMRGAIGAIVGAAFIIYAPNYTASLGNHGPQLIYALLILAVVYGRRVIELLRARRGTVDLRVDTDVTPAEPARQATASAAQRS